MSPHQPDSREDILKFAVLVDRRPSLTRDLPYGPEDLQWVTNTSTLIYGPRDAILIDTFTTSTQNEKLVDWVASFDRNLTHIYSTHGHGDHFFGIGQLLDRFENATAVATAGSVAQAQKHASPEMLHGFWERLFPGEIPSPPQVPSVIESTGLDLHGHELRILPMGFTDTEDSTVVWVPSLGLIVGGDVVYNHTHPYLAETTPDTRENWRSALAQLSEVDARVVVAGHKHSDYPDDPSNITETLSYLEDFEVLRQATTTAEELYAALLDKHPNRANPGSAWAAAKATHGA
ncbi:MBL fold metallo-hydrolase [Rhodococcus opacus]|uniref:MBL fold metallo-hydrolase n=1 Tax=Rhodococcus opacus TaxID=37919 RepID=UPI0024B888A5|nr:MBL fold metallo-hydrolase [Rhodococcus opacus]MDJ0418585.1 MBL fold metallo-hydrolase [Rhodococcus opacus]